MIAEADLAVQRPGTGSPAAMFGEVVGRRAARSLPAGTMLQREMLELEEAKGARLSHAA